jgi:pimeloyl-ACP methyl ester carboxylesterase
MTIPDTIVLVHGFWVTPRSWEHWITRYEQKGFQVVAPGYPGFEVEVEALNADPDIVTAVTVPAIIDKIEKVIQGLDQQPIIIGHSAGGAFTQILLDHGYGAAGVALNSAPTEGVRTVPLSQLKSTFPS